MKKVRFESPAKTSAFFQMPADSECHIPRPFTEKQIKITTNIPFYDNARPLAYTQDPLQRFECSNLSPYPVAGKTHISEISKIDEMWSPCNDLDLSILDSSSSSGKNSQRQQCNKVNERKPFGENNSGKKCETTVNLPPSNILQRNDDFFLRRENLNGNNVKGLQAQLNNLTLGKENNPLLKKKEIMNTGVMSSTPNICMDKQDLKSGLSQQSASCNIMHCSVSPCISKPLHLEDNCLNVSRPCFCMSRLPQCCSSCKCIVPGGQMTPHHFHNTLPLKTTQNAVDKKSWDIEKFNKTRDSLDVEVLKNREPTVSDLFKIIKLQNQQLQMLQEKVDKLISNKQVSQPISNFVTEQLDTVKEHKISIGVMTSFEMVRTSTIINKEVLKKSEAQIQCNRSQISIKEIVSKANSTNLNFLDGLSPETSNKHLTDSTHAAGNAGDLTKNTELQDEKTLNEFSLYNIQVDNATTPLMSPEQSMYLDVRDFSDSDSGDDHSNVGWTYYNKVMTHVNGMLQESDMPSSASALYRNTRQKCLQMQYDKTNISVAKRVTFGDEPQLGMQQNPYNKASSDTSLKMNQLAAKYLKTRTVTYETPSPVLNVPVDMSIATKNYMEKHKLLQGPQNLSRPPAPDIPKFLDITALKQQPKLL